MAKIFKRRPYQDTAVQRVHEAVAAGVQKPLIIMPTGGGKTAVFAGVAMERPGRTLLLLPKDVLLGQAEKAFLDVDSNLLAQMGIVQRQRFEPYQQIVFASVNTLIAGGGQRLKRMPTDYQTLIIDECHRAASKWYKEIIQHFSAVPCILGVTATWVRGDGISLGTVFDKIVYGNQPGDATVESLIKEGFLVEPVAYEINFDYDKARLRRGRRVENEVGQLDYDPTEVTAVMQAANWIEHAIKAYRTHATGRLTMGFVSSIELAVDAAAAMQAVGIRAQAVHGKMSPRAQRQMCESFKRREFDVLWSVDLLIEGIDVPPLDCIIFARPTQSYRIFQQICGRGLRPHPESGKRDCLILDLVGLNQEFDLLNPPELVGNDLVAECVEEREKSEGKAAVDRTKQMVDAELRAIPRNLMGGRLATHRQDKRLLPPTPAQLQRLKRFGVDTEYVYTRRQASEILSGDAERRQRALTQAPAD